MSTTSATMAAADQMGTLDQLEERIQKTVALVNRLRDERDLARMEVTEAQEANTKLAAELDVLRAEKTDVRTRLEKLLGHIDSISSAA
jgi:FtsZ-binding cell division protein ZapB